jgi:cytochrome b pre-mRNA-processing protein 3
MIEPRAGRRKWGGQLISLLGFRRKRFERPAFLLYGSVVAAARARFLYAELGVPDTLDGRFDLVGLYAFLLIERLRHAPQPGPALAQGIFDAMFSDMDVTLREMGVGDLSVGKKVKAMWEAFHGRALAYAAALSDKDEGALERAIARNVWRGSPARSGPVMLARLVRAEHGHLALQTLEDLAAGRVGFLGHGAVQ